MRKSLVIHEIKQNEKHQYIKKIVHFRTKLSNLQHVNKTPWLYVQQGKRPPINIQTFLYM